LLQFILTKQTLSEYVFLSWNTNLQKETNVIPMATPAKSITVGNASQEMELTYCARPGCSQLQNDKNCYLLQILQCISQRKKPCCIPKADHEPSHMLQWIKLPAKDNSAVH
jgi:hypothetical protein